MSSIRRIFWGFIFLCFLNSVILGFYPIDLNSASLEDLIKIPGIGKVIAKNIIEYREIHGPFTSVDELLKVKGIGPKKLSQIRPYLTISNFPSKKSLNFSNTSSSIYFYKDEKGILHYTQFPESVPYKYKSSLKKVE